MAKLTKMVLATRAVNGVGWREKGGVAGGGLGGGLAGGGKEHPRELEGGVRLVDGWAPPPEPFAPPPSRVVVFPASAGGEDPESFVLPPLPFAASAAGVA